MNRAYKLVWNTVSNSWVVASELAKGAKKSSGKTLKLAVFVAAGFSAGVALAAPAINALPTGENVASGSAIFDRRVTNQLTVNQSSSKLITNWNSFDVGSSGKVVFAQPDAASIALNRVTSGSASEIFGQVTANGQLVIVNPNGITFGGGSQVSAASIIGSVLDIQDSDFNAGTLLFSRGAVAGSIDNKGSLSATSGSVSLLAPTVKNSGTISATGGNAALINADAVDLTAVDPAITTASTITGLIQNSGNITATQVSSVGGKILLTGDSSQTGSVVELTGTLTADVDSAVSASQIKVAGVLDINGTNNILKLSSTSPYNLTFGSKINLNGASSGFSVNGTAYSVIRDVNQLQGMNTNLAGKYVLAKDVDASATSTWNSGAGFAPVGTDTSRFSGVLDGLGHAVNGLRINRPGTDFVGLIGSAGNSLIQNIGIGGSVRGGGWVGSLVGNNNNSSVNNSYATASVTGTYFVGGLLGQAANSPVSNSYATGRVTGSTYWLGGLIGNSNSPVSNSYATGNVSGTAYMGGLIGNNTSLVSNSYATGSVTGSYNIGGLIGGNDTNNHTNNIIVSNSYATGLVSGSSSVGGLVGHDNGGVITNSYWNVDTTGRASAVGGTDGNSTLSNLVGLSSSQMKNLSSFANWGSDIDAQGGTGSVWRIYEGQSGPLLRSFLKPLNVGNDSKTYDATAFTGSHSLPSGTDGTKIFGTATVSGNAIGAINAGIYSQTVSGLYSVQNGYDISDTGSVNINKASLSISATDVTRTYDGTTVAAGSAAAIGGTQLFGSDNLSGGTFAFDNKNAGSGKTLTVSGVVVNDGNNGGNYAVTYIDNTSSTINKAALVLTSTDVTKTYDGTNAAAGTAIATSGTQVFAGDSLTGGTFTFDNKNAGTGKTVTTSAVTVDDGNSGNNYDVTFVDNTNSTINKAALVLTTTDVSKTYDGTSTAAGTAVTTSGTELFAGDSISGGTFAFSNKNAGTGKTVTTSAVTVDDGNSGNNYALSYADNTSSTIDKRLLTISAVADSKVFDGKLNSAGKPVVVGRQRGDSIAGLTQSFINKNAGTGKTINVDASYVIRDGNNGNNYDVVLVNSTAGVITPKTLTISTVSNTKVYDGGVTSANKPVVTGLISGDRVTGLFQQYETKTVGENKKLLIKNGYVVQDGNAGGNYSVVQQTSNDGVITAH